MPLCRNLCDACLPAVSVSCSDFDEMEQLFSQQINPNLDMEELEAMCTEFKNDYNQRHFVRNDSFKAAAEGITGETRKIFIEFLERSCTAEFSGFLLYKVRAWLAAAGLAMLQLSFFTTQVMLLLAPAEAVSRGIGSEAMARCIPHLPMVCRSLDVA